MANVTSGGVLKQTSVLIPHAQILTLVTTPVTIVPAPGPNLMVYPLRGVLVLNITTTAYSKGGGTMQTAFGWGTQVVNGNNLLANLWETGNRFFTAVGPLYVVPFGYGTSMDGAGGNIWEPQGTATDFANVTFNMQLWNTAGNLTGGDARNFLRVSLLYLLFDVTTGLFA